MLQEYAQCLAAVETTLLELRGRRPEQYDRLARLLSAGLTALDASRVGGNLLVLASVARSIYLARSG